MTDKGYVQGEEEQEERGRGTHMTGWMSAGYTQEVEEKGEAVRDTYGGAEDGGALFRGLPVTDGERELAPADFQPEAQASDRRLRRLGRLRPRRLRRLLCAATGASA